MIRLYNNNVNNTYTKTLIFTYSKERFLLFSLFNTFRFKSGAIVFTLLTRRQFEEVKIRFFRIIKEDTKTYAT